MTAHDPSLYGDRIADVYDRLYQDMFDVEGTVERLVELAAGGRALELGIGTGRIALPLAARGVEVHGIDASEAMIARLREKPGGRDIPVTMGDFGDVDVEGAFSVVYVPFNTMFALTTQDDQVRCFRNVADHLTPDGVFALDAFVPDLTRFDRHQRVAVEDARVGEVQLEVTRHDPVAQQSLTHHVFITERGVKMYPTLIRYAHPSELDLMARLAGLRLRSRWGTWRGHTFSSESAFHVSVYERAS